MLFSWSNFALTIITLQIPAVTFCLSLCNCSDCFAIFKLTTSVSPRPSLRGISSAHGLIQFVLSQYYCHYSYYWRVQLSVVFILRQWESLNYVNVPWDLKFGVFALKVLLKIASMVLAMNRKFSIKRFI